ncbi:hypothetical protein CHARACLAT_010728 [Characodon lateralis]|uniref:Uncharacterized protein n=1 Tax=Characodon lateralis TaxID=208331 RepID=A0ABU7DII3_9TELE|nr:hypothetical protein [Characodon lateralis]
MGDVLLEVHHHLHSLEGVLNTPVDQPIISLSVCTLFIVLDQTIDICAICELQEFHRCVRCRVVISTERSRERTHLWEGLGLMILVQEKMLPSLACCCWSDRKLKIY